MKNKYRSIDDLLEDYLHDPEFAMSFLNQALEDEDVDALKVSLKDIIRVHGNVSNLAKEAHISRGTIYNVINGRGQMEIGTVLKLIHAPGYNLTVSKREQTA